jgi:hypothetical protein
LIFLKYFIDDQLENLFETTLFAEFCTLQRFIENCRRIRSLPEPNKSQWLMQTIEPTHVKEMSCVPENATFIWYQHLWADDVNKLMKDFLTTASIVQKCTEHEQYAIIGINTHEKYFWAYNIMNERSLQELNNDYEFVGCDTGLMKEIRMYGYYHKGRHDVHHYIDGKHVLLFFRRKQFAVKE